MVAALFAAHAGCVVNRRRTADEMRQFGMEFGQEVRIVLVAGVGGPQFIDGVG